MPLIKSHSDEDREKNIKEMIAAGHEPEQAVAASYANQRKYKKMAEGGMVMESVQDTMPRSLEEQNLDSQPYNHEELLAKALSGEYTQDGKTGMASGGMVMPPEKEPHAQDKGPLISEEAMEALRKKKKTWNYA